MAGKLTQNWADKPDPDDFPAAADYLSLLMPDATAKRLVRGLRTAPIARRKAKDLLRASRLPVLPPENLHVAKDVKKVNAGKKLSPVLLVRGRIGEAEVPLIVADGYHRICASYHLDENADIPCRLVDLTPR
jgi:hypothetical protein